MATSLIYPNEAQAGVCPIQTPAWVSFVPTQVRSAHLRSHLCGSCCQSSVRSFAAEG